MVLGMGRGSPKAATLVRAKRVRGRFVFMGGECSIEVGMVSTGRGYFCYACGTRGTCYESVF